MVTSPISKALPSLPMTHEAQTTLARRTETPDSFVLSDPLRDAGYYLHQRAQILASQLSGFARHLFPPYRDVRVQGETFRVQKRAVGDGGESVVWRLFDDPSKKIKIFRLPTIQEGESLQINLNLVKIPQEYIDCWIERMKNIQDSGIVTAKIHTVGRGYVIMEYTQGVKYNDTTGLKKLGYTSDQIRQIRGAYWQTIEKIKSLGLGHLDGSDTFNNMLWDPVDQVWVVIDA